MFCSVNKNSSLHKPESRKIKPSALYFGYIFSVSGLVHTYARKPRNEVCLRDPAARLVEK